MNKKYMYATSAALLVLVFAGGIESARAVDCGVQYAECKGICKDQSKGTFGIVNNKKLSTCIATTCAKTYHTCTGGGGNPGVSNANPDLL